MAVLSTRCRPSLIPSGGLEIPLMIRVFLTSEMNDFMTKLYCYDHKPVTKNAESDSDSDEFHIEIKENVVEEGEDSEVVVAPKAKKRKVTIAYNSDNSEEEKERTQKKTTFENDSDDAIPESVSKLNKTVSYDNTDSDN